MSWAFLRRLLLRLRAATLAVLVPVLAACASLPTPVDRSASTAIEGGGTPLAMALASAMRAQNAAVDQSALRLLPAAPAAFEARVALIRAAQRSLDVQYYLIKDDATGQFFLQELHAAALRGVRVRLLLDDLYTVGEDEELAALGKTPGFEIRVFNPFPAARGALWSRFFASFSHLGVLSHRMHNKLLIADSVAAIAGGRNIGDEYFLSGSKSNFVDLDVFVAGGAVAQFIRSFDAFWNDDLSFDVRDVDHSHSAAPDDAALLSGAFQKALAPKHELLPVPLASFGTLADEIRTGEYFPFVITAARVTSDPPEKARTVHQNLFMATVTRDVLAMIAGAQQDVVITSPYFIPGQVGLDMIHEASERGIQTLVITNSLASTDVAMAQIGYARYRVAMLREGVHIHEMSPSLVRERQHFGPFGRSSGSLHAKVVMVDQRKLFIGSMNLDFRSAYDNTEVGLIAESPVLCAQLLGLVDQGSFYDLGLDAKGNVTWTVHGDDADVTYLREPESSWLTRLIDQLIEPFVPESEL